MHPTLQISSDESVVPVLIFQAGKHCCCIAASSVECVVDVVAIEPLPGAPRAVLGVVNFHGTIVPVVDPRRRFGERGGNLDCSQKLIIVHAPQRTIALLADTADQVEWIEPSRISAVEDFIPGASVIKGSVARQNDVVLVHDAEQLLTQSEARSVDASLRRRAV